MSVQDRLGRLLFIVPYVAHRDGVPLTELAEKLGATVAQIEADLDLLAMVGQPPLTPDHLIDLYVEDDVVYVDLDQSLSRPLQLTHEEASALVLGARLVGGLGGLREALDAVLAKIADRLNPADRERLRVSSERIGVSSDQASEAPAAELRAAVEQQREVVLDYYSASSDRQKCYRLRPLALISHGGIEYLVALDVEAEGQEKLFRLDRVGRVELTDARFTPPDELDLERFRTQRLYFGERAATAEVRLSAKAAAQVVERFRKEDVTREPEGAVRVRVSTSSSAWLSRWVLPFGLDAEVVAPGEAREYLAELCEQAAAAYRRPAR